MTQVQVVITFDQSTGQVQITGPIENSILVYGMLEAAKDAIRNHQIEAAKNQKLSIVRQSLPNSNGHG